MALHKFLKYHCFSCRNIVDVKFMYQTLRRLLFQLNPELAHHFSLGILKRMEQFGLLSGISSTAGSNTCEIAGIVFKNKVGLAAGLDKNGDYILALSKLGFSSIEVGTITPRPQPGNPKPRLFRIPEKQAIINRMGFNNKGIEHLINNIKQLPESRDFVLGVNIGKNFDTAVENALDDYSLCLKKVYPLADYVTINISSPNTPGLRHLQFGDQLEDLLEGLNTLRNSLQQQYQKRLPLFLKIAPDMDDEEVKTLAKAVKKYEMDAVIATNTTISREKVSGLPYADEAGGLSGEPVFEQSTHILSQLSEALGKDYPLIGVGGIMNLEQAKKKIEVGAAMVQIYTGFIYQGPSLIKSCARGL